MTSINVAGLLRQTPGAVRQLRLRDRYLSLGPDLELAGPLDGDLRLLRTNRGILVRGTIEAPVRRTCARCLDPYVEAVRVDIAEEYLPTVDPEHGTPLEAPAADETALPIDARHQLDLTSVMHDELALAEPMHPLCRPDCRGLCPGCGRRLDIGSCDCASEQLDPRLQVLARFREGHPN